MRLSLASRPMTAFPYCRRVGFRIALFEACSTFNRVMARMVAEPPKTALLSECFRQYRYRYHPLRLLPAGATVAGRDSHPLGNGAFPRRTEISGLNCSSWSHVRLLSARETFSPYGAIFGAHHHIVDDSVAEKKMDPEVNPEPAKTEYVRNPASHSIRRCVPRARCRVLFHFARCNG